MGKGKLGTCIIISPGCGWEGVVEIRIHPRKVWFGREAAVREDVDKCTEYASLFQHTPVHVESAEMSFHCVHT